MKYPLFPSRLKELLKENKLQQNQIASDFFVTKQTVSRWVNGHIVPDIHTLVKLAAYFDVDLNYLLGQSSIKNLEKYNTKYDIEKIKREIRFLEYLDFIGCDSLELDEKIITEFIDSVNDFIKQKYKEIKERTEKNGKQKS